MIITEQKRKRRKPKKRKQFQALFAHEAASLFPAPPPAPAPSQAEQIAISNKLLVCRRCHCDNQTFDEENIIDGSGQWAYITTRRQLWCMTCSRAWLVRNNKEDHAPPTPLQLPLQFTLVITIWPP